MKVDCTVSRRSYKRRDMDKVRRKRLARDLCAYIMQQNPSCVDPDQYKQENEYLTNLAKWDAER